MPAVFNIRHVEQKTLELRGELPIEELDWGPEDECVHTPDPVIYDLEVQELDNAWLVQGHVSLKLHCECVRCLKEFVQVIDFPDWACHLPRSGEDAPVIKNDLIDLTPYIREDILLAIPQHPLCEAGCPGLGPSKAITGSKGSDVARDDTDSSTWAALNKLKL